MTDLVQRLQAAKAGSRETEIEVLFPGLLDEIATGICEGDSHDELEEGEHGYFWVSDRHWVNRLNQIIVGSFWVDGVELTFEAESGDRNGWMWRDISPDKPVARIEDIAPKPTVYALQPNEYIVRKSMAQGQSYFLLVKWDAFLKRKDLAELPRKYMYDKHFAPGSKTESYWRGKAEKVGFILVPEDQANETRAILKAQAMLEGVRDD